LKTITRTLVFLVLFISVTSYAEHAVVIVTPGHWTTTSADGVEAKLVANGDTFDRMATPPVDLSPYDQIWDIRVDEAVSPADQTAYQTFLSNGDRIFLLGENSGFPVRNNSLLSFIDTLGGGSGLSLTSECDTTQTVNAPWAWATPSTVAYPCANNFSQADIGNGVFMSTNVTGNGAALSFSPGSLTNASSGTLAVVLDANFMQPQYWTNASYPGTEEFTEALVKYVGGIIITVPDAPPLPVPTLSNWAQMLLVLMMFGLGLHFYPIFRRSFSRDARLEKIQ
jgi:hypothetical protein